MIRDTDVLIAGLVDDLKPTPPLRFSRGALLVALGLLLSTAMAVLGFGMRPDVQAGRPDAMFILSGGLFLLLGAACSVATVAMSSPWVGSGRNGWGWAAAMAGLLPLTALVVALIEGRSAIIASEPAHGLVCIACSSFLALIVGGVLVSWLRQGAPTSLERAGLLTGISAGCAGVVAFTFVCPINSVMHIGLWHGLTVTVCAIAGRLIVPPLVRW